MARGDPGEGTHLLATDAPSDTATRLRELMELKEQGVLDDEEFKAAKAKILATM